MLVAKVEYLESVVSGIIYVTATLDVGIAKYISQFCWPWRALVLLISLINAKIQIQNLYTHKTFFDIPAFSNARFKVKISPSSLSLPHTVLHLFLLSLLVFLLPLAS